MVQKRLKRPRDPVQLAKLVGDVARALVKDEVDGAPAAEFAPCGGVKGGLARAAKLAP